MGCRSTSANSSRLLHERNDRHHLCLDIEDTNSGIAINKIERIYDPFFTTKEPGSAFTPSVKAKGTGLGLFIVRQIIERNKGRISVQSTLGQGTTFFLEFPAASPAAVAA